MSLLQKVLFGLLLLFVVVVQGGILYKLVAIDYALHRLAAGTLSVTVEKIEEPVQVMGVTGASRYSRFGNEPIQVVGPNEAWEYRPVEVANAEQDVFTGAWPVRIVR